MKACTWKGCDRPLYCLGYCGVHYGRSRRGAPMDAPVRPTGLSLEERFWLKVDKQPGGCWIWTGSRQSTGYGRLSAQVNGVGRHLSAHRYSYELNVGPIPDGLVIDHLCRTPLCVNPEHLEPVTPAENAYRGVHPNIQAWREGRCRRGHPFTPENTTWMKNGTRLCRICRAANVRQRYQAKREREEREAS